MDLIAISYKNIWPFENQLQTIFFDKWNFLIKSPIWSWKSFLFFDWPIYWLYKFSSRNILNIKSKTWFIKLLFSINNETYLITRDLKSWKSKDSCTSRLYKIHWQLKIDNGKWDQNSQLKSLDIQDLLSNQLEELSFKNETDLQQNLSSFLPEKEVFLSTIFLMQDAPNIFELQPAERLNVLKSVFWLLSIDSATEIISERRRDIQAKIKVHSDTSSYDSKLKKLLNSYISSYKTLSESQLFNNVILRDNEVSSFIQEITILAEKININEFETSNFPKHLSEEIENILNEQKEKYQKLNHEIENLNSNIKEQIVWISEAEDKEKVSKAEILEIEKKINSIDEKKLLEMKKKKLNLISTQNELNSSVDKNQIYSFFESNIENFDDLKIKNSEEINLQITNNIIEKLKNKWVFFKSEQNTIQAKINTISEQKKNIQNQIDDLKLEKWTNIYKIYLTEIDKIRQWLNNEFSILETEISNLTEKEKTYQESQKNLEKKIQQFEKSFDSQTIFNCEKIWANCPFIQKINKKTFDELEKQKKLLNDEKTNLEAKIQSEDLNKKIKKAKEKKTKTKDELTKLEDKPESFLKDFFKELDEKKTWIDKQIRELKLWWKQ